LAKPDARKVVEVNQRVDPALVLRAQVDASARGNRPVTRVVKKWERPEVRFVRRHRRNNLAHVAGAFRGPRAFTCHCERWEKEGEKEGHQGYDDEQLNQRECAETEARAT
jgi:hypothetical protein